MEIAIERSGRGSGIQGLLTTRHSVDEGSLTVGRGYHCDVILPDPRIDAAHLELGSDAQGLWVRDNRTVNGTRLNGEPLPAGEKVPLASGGRLQLGRTELAVFQSNHRVGSAVSPTSNEHLKHRLSQMQAWLPLTAFCLLAYLGLDYLSFPTDYDGEVLLRKITGFLIGPAVWMFFWSFVNKIVRGEFNFPVHWSIAIAGTVAIPLLEEMLQLVGFNWPSLNAYRVLDALTTGALTIAALYLSLSIATSFQRGPRWVGSVVPAVFLLLTSYAGPLLGTNERVSSPELLALSRPPVFKVVGAVSAERYLEESRTLFIESRTKAAEQRAEELEAALELAQRR